MVGRASASGTPQTERLEAPGVEAFWERRAGRVLDLVDRLGTGPLHALRHLLRGSLRLAHVLEIAAFLESRGEDVGVLGALAGAASRATARARNPLRSDWRDASSGRRRSKLICRRAPGAGSERYAWSPVEAHFRPIKHELYLHMSLLDAWPDRWQVARRRLLPLGLPGPVDAVHVPEEQMTVGRQARRWFRQSAFAASRALHHARALAPTLWGLATWRTNAHPRE